MKTRLSFVSNSSSSSFCICGVPFSRKEFFEDFNDFDDFDTFEALNHFDESISNEQYDELLYSDEAKAIIPLVIRNTEEEGEVGVAFIGLPMEKMDEFETKGQFRRRAYEALQRIGYRGDIDSVHFYTGSARH